MASLALRAFNCSIDAWEAELRDAGGAPARFGAHQPVAAGLTPKSEVEELPDGFTMRLAIDNRAGLTLWRVIWPRLSCRVSEEAKLFAPEKLGRLIDVTELGRYRAYYGVYPSHLASMQFLGLIDGGRYVYLGVHDAEWRYKALGASSQCKGEYCLVNLWIEHYPEGLGEPDNGFDPGYQVVIKEGAGPPWRLAEHYEVAARARGAEPPEWVWEIGLWVTTYYSEGLPKGPHVRRPSIEELLEAIRLVREALGYPLALHCYSWFKGEFDANYPSYEPVEGARGYFESLRRLGVRIVPYVNARLWDIGWRWGEEPYKYAVKLAGPRLRPGAHAPAYEIYPTSGQIHAVMCPAAEGWRKRILEIARTVKDLGADGVYLDQIAAAPPYLCLDAGHGHPRGGGGWWAKAYRELLAQIAEEGLLVVSELEAEAYVGALHGLLDWVSFASGFYPLHIALYGGKVVYLGRSFAMHEISDADLLAAKLGEQIAYGVQPGWIDVLRLARAVERAEVLEVLRTYGEAYRHINWIFRAHKIDLGAVAQFDEKTFYLSIDPEAYAVEKRRLPAVLATIWRGDDREFLVAVNITGDEQEGVVKPISAPTAAKALHGSAEVWIEGAN